MQAAKKLSNLQLELLKVFSFDISEAQVIEIRDMLKSYFAKKVTDDIDELFEANNWGEEKIKEWSEEHIQNQIPS